MPQQEHLKSTLTMIVPCVSANTVALGCWFFLPPLLEEGGGGGGAILGGSGSMGGGVGEGDLEIGGGGGVAGCENTRLGPG